MIENIEVGERLQGSIFKDGEIYYEDRIFITSLDKEKEALGEGALQFDILDDAEPKVAENDICQLILKDGQEMDIQVTKVAEVVNQYLLFFSFYPISLTESVN